jgi:preprotein translocase subunit SecE
MSLAIYKPGQGYWTRVMSAIGLAVIVLMGANWLWGLLSTSRIGKLEPVYIQASAVFVLIAIFGVLGYYLIGVKPRVVEFLIATEGEMKKVNWSNRREIMGSTWVVIGVTVFLAVLCFGFDAVYQFVFQEIGVLRTATGT